MPNSLTMQPGPEPESKPRKPEQLIRVLSAIAPVLLKGDRANED